MLQTLNTNATSLNIPHIPRQHRPAILTAAAIEQQEEKGCATVMGDEKVYGLINDVVFKFVFGQRKDRRILICLVNALLKLEKSRKIKDIEIINPYNYREFMEGKESIVDIYAEDEEGRLYNIELQVAPQRGYISRVLYYAGKLYCRQLGRNQPFEELKKTISISIVDFTIFQKTEELHNIFRLKNVLTNEVLTDILELHFLELGKFKKDKPRYLCTPFEKWLHVLKFGDIYTGERITGDTPGRGRD